MKYRVEFTSPAQRDLKRLPRQVVQRLSGVILNLREDPRPRGVKKVQGRENAWRIRIGRYRIVYAIFDDQRLVLVTKVDLRNEGTYRL
jgi:mRNA interferase RelE/StbE